MYSHENDDAVYTMYILGNSALYILHEDWTTHIHVLFYLHSFIDHDNVFKNTETLSCVVF